MALDRFDRLVNAATAEELRVVDEIVQAKPEFSIYTNLSRRFSTANSTLDERPARGGDDFNRRGLPWLMALARLEWAAILVGFSDAKQPLAQVRPSNFESVAFAELLADAVRVHYWSLRSDPVAQDAKRAQLSEARAIAYTRRVHLAVSLLRAFRALSGDALVADQAAELKQWERQLVELELTLLFDVLKLGLGAVGASDNVSVDRSRQVGGIQVPDAQLNGLPQCVQEAVRDQSQSQTQAP